ncbi:Sugar phosphate permease [Sanguibacter gelidistatuariae]|uniref:Sugar phosphate permease n=1 Tax=Sanguibacter gelidistatuariae TaxID=1814289 RepID=A0A1G6H4K0_9MICO|nr:MFS transporter [Sanguibacter gelidistatuariae]SDB88346.1 Sugar phosphate permease [Sanguibacter gelidistatuariae]
MLSGPLLDVAPTRPTRQARRARLAVSVLFALNGFIYANLLPRYPELMSALDLTKAGLGTAIAGAPLGALVGGLFAGRAIARWGSRRVALTGAMTMAVVFSGVGFAGSWGALVALMFVTGVFDALVDVGDNAHGLRVQRIYGRSIINALHGVWCVGAVAGGITGSLAAAAGLPLTVHLPLVAVVVVVAALLVAPLMLPGSDRSEVELEASDGGEGDLGAGAASGGDVALWRRPRVLGRLVGLGAIATIGAMVEDLGNSWGAVYVVDDLGAPVALAGSAFLAMMTALLIGRFVADRAVDQFGPRAVAALGSVLVVIGIGATMAWPTLTMAYVGFALAGFGAAVMIPLATTTADEISGLAPGTGVAFVSWFMRFGCFAGPPVVGMIADGAGLRLAFGVGVAAGVLGVALAPLLAGRPDRRARPQD